MTVNSKRIVSVIVLVLVIALLAASTSWANPFSGKGKKTTGKFALKPGLYVFQVEHKGFSKFDFSFKDANGKLVRVLAQGTGPYKGDTFVGIAVPKENGKKKATPPKTPEPEKEQVFFIDANCDGAWTVTITEPEVKEEVRQFKGETNTKEVSEVFRLKKGIYEFKAKHQGGMEFEAAVFDESGQKVLDLAKGVGQVSEVKKLKVAKENRYILEITASGKWSVNIERVMK